MLIAIYWVVVNTLLPRIGAYAQALLEPAMIIILTLVGITIILGAVGMRISNNLGSTIVGGIFRGIGYLCRTLLNALGWIVRSTFRMIPRIFRYARRTFGQMGLSVALSNVLATLVVIVFVAIII